MTATARLVTWGRFFSDESQAAVNRDRPVMTHACMKMFLFIISSHLKGSIVIAAYVNSYTPLLRYVDIVKPTVFIIACNLPWSIVARKNIANIAVGLSCERFICCNTRKGCRCLCLLAGVA